MNYETVVNVIGATKTRTGLRVKAVLDTGTYHKGLTVEEEVLRDVQLRRTRFIQTGTIRSSPYRHNG